MMLEKKNNIKKTKVPSMENNENIHKKHKTFANITKNLLIFNFLDYLL